MISIRRAVCVYKVNNPFVLFSYRMIEVAKSMGLTLSRTPQVKAEEDGQGDEHRLASLILPLVKYNKFVERQKRKKMRWREK